MLRAEIPALHGNREASAAEFGEILRRDKAWKADAARGGLHLGPAGIPAKPSPAGRR